MHWRLLPKAVLAGLVSDREITSDRTETWFDKDWGPMELVPFAPQHIPTLASWFRSEREMVQWAGPTLSFPIDHGALQAMIDEGRGNPPTRLCWMAQSAGALVGHAQLAFDWWNGNVSLSRVAIAPAERGRGLAHPMLQVVIGEAFAHPQVARVELSVYLFNKAALRAYDRLGFVAEGIRRSSARVGDERWDTAIMGLLRAEWRP